MKAGRCALFALVLYAMSNAANGMVGAIYESGKTVVEITNWIIEMNSPDKMEVLADQVSNLANVVDSFERKSEVLMTIGMENLLRQLQTGMLLSDNMRRLNDHMNKISAKYEESKDYANLTAGYSNFTLNNFATNCVNSLPQTFLDLQSIILRNDSQADPNLLKIMADDFKGKVDTHCFEDVSHQSLLYRLWNRIAVAEIKGLAVMKISYMLLSYLGNGQLTPEMQRTLRITRSRITETMDAFQMAMSSASPDVWRCDPKFPIGKSDYTEVHFLQAYVILQTYLYPADGWCDNPCSVYKNTHEVDGEDPYGYFATIRGRQPDCKDGELHNCENYNWKHAVCLAPDAINRTIGRRYDYIERRDVFGTKVGVFGKKEKDCDENRFASLTSTYLFNMDTTRTCNLCICTCLEPIQRSTAYFYSGEVYADVLLNKVVTGIRFMRSGWWNYLQIEEGELLAEGKIANTTRWVEPLHKHATTTSSKMGVDVWWIFLTWSDRAIDLDELVATEPGHCLTGVRFQKKNSHIRLEIMTTPFNLTTGKLIDPLTTSRWHGNDDTTPKRPVVLKNPDRPTVSQLPSINNFGKNQYVEFVTTDMDKDAGQSTVPFIDTQTVRPNPRTVLAGAGLYFKGREGYGGYIAPKLTTYNLGLHLRTDHSVSD